MTDATLSFRLVPNMNNLEHTYQCYLVINHTANFWSHGTYYYPSLHLTANILLTEDTLGVTKTCMCVYGEGGGGGGGGGGYWGRTLDSSDPRSNNHDTVIMFFRSICNVWD